MSAWSEGAPGGPGARLEPADLQARIRTELQVALAGSTVGLEGMDIPRIEVRLPGWHEGSALPAQVIASAVAQAVRDRLAGGAFDAGA